MSCSSLARSDSHVHDHAVVLMAMDRAETTSRESRELTKANDPKDMPSSDGALLTAMATVC